MALRSRELIVSRLNKCDWSTRSRLPYRARDIVFEVPRGFVTDFASVPKILYSLFPAHGIYILAAIIHDYLLSLLKRRKSPLNSNDIDGMIRRVAREEGTDYVTAWSVWTGVRWGALFSEQGYRREGWFLWGNLWRVAVWTILLFPAVLLCVVGVGLAYLWLTALRLCVWALRLS